MQNLTNVNMYLVFPISDWNWRMIAGTMYLFVTRQRDIYLYIAGDPTQRMGKVVKSGTLLYPDDSYKLSTRPFEPVAEFNYDPPMLSYILADTCIHDTKLHYPFRFLLKKLKDIGAGVLDGKPQQFQSPAEYYECLLRKLADLGIIREYEELELSQMMEKASDQEEIILVDSYTTSTGVPYVMRKFPAL